MNPSYVVILITAPNQETAEVIARKLVEEHLVACVNLVVPVRSLYTWEGKVNDEQEILLIAKTRAELVSDRLIPAVKTLHPYQVPEIIALPILMGSSDYLNWIHTATQP